MSVSSFDENFNDIVETSKHNIVHLYFDAEQSSFEEVAGICSNKDDPDMPCLTVRSFIIGLSFVIGMSVLHMWIYSSPTSAMIHLVLVVLVSHAVGKIWSLIPWKTMNGGLWTIKEHAVVLIMADIAWTFFRVYSFATIAYLQYRERQLNFKFPYSYFIIIAVQFLGYGLAGILRRFLVWPSSAVWPINFPYIALLRTLHETQTNNKRYGNHSRWHRFISNYCAFFWVITIIQFIYCWFPFFIMPVLGAFSWMCMMKPTNYLLSQLTGYYGLGMGSFSFNWFNITWTLGYPTILPRWAVVNIAVGFVFATWIVTPIVYFTNVWNTYNNTIAEVTRSTSNWSAISIVSTAAAFANLAAVLIHMFLHHSKALWNQLRARSLKEKGNDVHCRLIALYPDVPDWWFFIVSLLAFIVLVVVGQVSHILLWYETFLTIIVPIFLVLPFGMVTSITGITTQNTSVYYLLAVIATSFWATNESASLAFVTIGYSTYCQTMQLIKNMKLGHYMRIAPRILFFIQLVACFVSPSISIGIQYYYFKKKDFTANQTTSLATGDFQSTNIGSAIVNGINFFGPADWKNTKLLWSLLIGAILPIVFWSAKFRWRWCRLIHIPLMLTFISWMPIVAAGALFTWLLIGFLTTFFFDELYRKRHVYLATSALDAGLFSCLLIINGPLAQYGVQFPSWWGWGGMHQDGCPLALLNTTGFSVDFQN